MIPKSPKVGERVEKIGLGSAPLNIKMEEEENKIQNDFQPQHAEEITMLYIKHLSLFLIICKTTNIKNDGLRTYGTVLYVFLPVLLIKNAHCCFLFLFLFFLTIR